MPEDLDPQGTLSSGPDGTWDKRQVWGLRAGGQCYGEMWSWSQDHEL